MGEVGVFLRAIASAKADRDKAEILNAWLAHNSDAKGIKEVLKTLERSKASSKEPDGEEVLDNWKKMQSFFGGGYKEES